jgi:hypothetical protein
VLHTSAITHHLLHSLRHAELFVRWRITPACGGAVRFMGGRYTVNALAAFTRCTHCHLNTAIRSRRSHCGYAIMVGHLLLESLEHGCAVPHFA